MMELPRRWWLSGYPFVEIAPTALVRVWKIKGLSRQSHFAVGDESIVHASVSLDRTDAHVKIGARTFVGASSIVSATHVEIGDDVMISWGATIVDHDSHNIAFAERSQDVLDWRSGRKDWSTVKQQPVRVQDKAWIGFNAIILKGVTIGEGAVVGAGAVVTHDVEPWTVVVGNPARKVKTLK